jgi:hypothetical protein
MQTNGPLSIPSTSGTGAVFPSSTEVKKASPVTTKTESVAVEQLETGDTTSTAANLQSKDIKAPPAGMFESIRRFFNRRFSPITDTKQQQAQDIRVLIGRVEIELAKLTRETKKAQYAEKNFSGKTPNKDSIKATTDHLTKSRQLLKKASDHLTALKKEEDSAQQLAADHSVFEDLPVRIQLLEENVRYLEARVEVLEHLLNLEVSLEAYHPDKTWDQFVEIQEQRKELTYSLKDLIESNPALQRDVEAQAYLSKAKWRADDVHEVMHLIFPGLRTQLERLFDNALNAQKTRLNNLEGQVKDLNQLLAKHEKQSNQIYYLEKAIHGTSFLRKFSRLWYGKMNLRQQLQELKKEQKKTYEEIEVKGQFNSEELDWVKIIGKVNPKRRELRRNVEIVRHHIKKLETTQNLSDHMTELLHNLEIRHKLNVKNASEEYVNFDKLDERITSNFKELAGDIKDLKFRQGVLPPDFTKMDLVDQLKILVSASAPMFKERNRMIFKLIEEEDLHANLNEIIKKEYIEDDEESELETGSDTSSEASDSPLASPRHTSNDDEEEHIVSAPITPSSSPKTPTKSALQTSVAPPPPPPPPVVKQTTPPPPPPAAPSQNTANPGAQTPALTKTPSQPADLLAQIQNGLKLKAAANDAKEGSLCDQLLAKMRKGELKYHNIPKGDLDQLSHLDILALKMEEQRLAMNGNDGNDNDSADDNWDD